MAQDDITTSEELRTLLGGLLRTRHISQPLVCCDAADDRQVAMAQMQRHGFTALGVQDQGRVIGSVDSRHLRSGTCGEQAELLGEGDLIDGDTPLLDLFRRLSKRHWLFVRGADGINGFVSRSDLQRAPVRMLLFGLVSLFEMLLVDLVQRNYPEATIAETLNSNRLEQARRRHHERELRGEQLNLVDCLQIADKRDLLLAADGCTRRLGFSSNNAASRFFYGVEELRDRLVHANDLVGGSSWEEVLSTALQLADFLERCSQPG